MEAGGFFLQGSLVDEGEADPAKGQTQGNESDENVIELVALTFDFFESIQSLTASQENRRRC